MKRVVTQCLACLLALCLLASGLVVALAEDYFTGWTQPDVPIFHLGLSTASPSDGNWNNYRFVAQEFVPAEENISGVKIALNLTQDAATVHVELREDVNGEAFYSNDVDITSLGNGRNWYTIGFGENVTVTPGKTYYLVYYLSARSAASVCIVYGSDVGAGQAAHPGYVWQMASGDPQVFDAGAGNLVFSFELITDYDETGYFTKWTQDGAPITHLGLSSATDDDANWNNYSYVAQEFVPMRGNVSGARIALNLTQGNATVHAEIRQQINDEPLLARDIQIESQGDGRYWYSLDFQKNLKVIPGETYYLVYWLVQRDAASVCIAYGSDVGVGNAEHPAYLYKQSAGGDVSFSQCNYVVMCFEIITEITEEPAVRQQWNSFDNGGVTHEAGRTQNPTTDTDNYLEGTGSFRITSKDGNANNAQVFFYFHPDTAYPERPTLDVTEAAYVVFDLYLSESIKKGNILDAGFNVSNTDVWDAGGKLCESSVLKAMDWNQGWNHVVIPINWDLVSASFDKTVLKRGRFYIVYNGDFSGITFAIDDLCFVASEGMEDDALQADAKRVVADIMQLPAAEDLTYSDGEIISELQTRYNALPAAYRPLVYNQSVLNELNDAYNALVGCAADVNAMLNALPATDALAYVHDQDVQTLVAMYDGLSPAQQAMVERPERIAAAAEKMEQLLQQQTGEFDAAVLAANAASYADPYGVELGWKIDPGQNNNWALFNFNNDFPAGTYRLGVRVKYSGLSDERPAISLKCADRKTGEDELLKRDCGSADFDAETPDGLGFVTLFTDVFTVTEEMTDGRQLEGGLFVYNDFHPNMEVIIASVMWVDADDTSVICKQVTADDLAAGRAARVLTGELVYDTEYPVRIEYEADPNQPKDTEIGYIINDVPLGRLQGGTYFLDLDFVTDGDSADALFDVEVFGSDGKLASSSVTGNTDIHPNSLDVGYVRTVFELPASDTVTLKVYQYNGGNVSYRGAHLYQTSVAEVDEAVQQVIDLIDALPAAEDVTADNAAAVASGAQAARAAYDTLTDEQKQQVTNADKLAAVEAALAALAPAYKPGDVNDDGDVDAKDALLILKHAVKKITLNDVQQLAANVNKDNAIDARDALMVLQFAVGKIQSL